MFKILIVEDSVLFRDALHGALQGRFPCTQFEEAADVREAECIADVFHPDLVFVDIRLHDESGLELTRRLKAASTTTPVVVLTSYDLPEYKREALSCGADYYLVKGQFQHSEMLLLVESIIPTHKPPSPQTYQ